MGTRNLTMVYLDGEYKVAQYGQWDGYPGGQGATVFKFLKEANLETFKEKCRKVKFLTEKECEEASAELKADGSLLDIGRKWEHLNRNVCADILYLIYREPYSIKLQNSIDFAADSLFCEWAYLINFDENQLEVYRGFNKSPLNEGDRFFNIPIDDYQKTKKYPYYQIRIAGIFDLDHLPTIEEFIKILDPPEEEE
jgi:hypothetical protein